MVKLLIELGCQVGAKNNEGFTAAEYSFSFVLFSLLSDTLAHLVLRRSFEGMKALEEVKSRSYAHPVHLLIHGPCSTPAPTSSTRNAPIAVAKLPARLTSKALPSPGVTPSATLPLLMSIMMRRMSD